MSYGYLMTLFTESNFKPNSQWFAEIISLISYSFLVREVEMIGKLNFEVGHWPTYHLLMTLIEAYIRSQINKIQTLCRSKVCLNALFWLSFK